MSLTRLRNLFPLCGILALALLSGCGPKGDFSTAQVEGVIKTQDGKPVEKGKIKFNPIPTGDVKAKSGKPAVGRIKDGKFVLTTYGNEDGAVIGKHEVFLADARVGSVAVEISPEFKTVEVTADGNNFEFTVVPKQKKRGEYEEEEDDD